MGVCVSAGMFYPLPHQAADEHVLLLTKRKKGLGERMYSETRLLGFFRSLFREIFHKQEASFFSTFQHVFFPPTGVCFEQEAACPVLIKAIIDFVVTAI